VILAGFMGSGKSAVGRMLAARLGWAFVDTDALIERRAGKSVSAIFDEDGEPAFRAFEREIARQLAGVAHQVVATGGGMVVDPENVRLLETAGTLVLLEARPETLWDRVRRQSHRPLLTGPEPEAALRRLWEARQPAYGRIARRVATDGKTLAGVADEILELLNA
jgi:shikimate kinase